MNNVLLSLPPSIQAQQPRIGLVVDDAIVVVEAVEHHIEQGLDPKRASLKAMEEISGPGARDRLHPDDLHPRNHRPSLSTIRRYHRHFGNALGVQCADSQPGAGRSAAETAYAESRSAAPVLRCLQRYFERSTESYLRWARVLIDKGAVAFAVLTLAGVGAALISQRIPSSFLPVEDQGYLFMHMQLPTGASLERTEAAAQKIEQVLAHAGSQVYNQCSRSQSAESSRHDLHGLLLRHSGRVGRSPEPANAVPGNSSTPQPRAIENTRWPGLQLSAARDSRRGHIRWIHICARGSRR